MAAAVGNMGPAVNPFGQQQEEQHPPPRELEVVTADMETRLRGTILRLIRPALDQTADLTARLEFLGEQVARHEDIMTEAEKQREVILQQGQFMQLISERLDDLDGHVRKIERSMSADITDLRSSDEQMGKRLEETEVELRKQGRDAVRAWEECARLQEQHDDAVAKMWEGIAACNKKTERAREECMEIVRELQSQREELVEELYGDGKGLTKIARDLAALTKFCQPVPELERQLRTNLDQASRLEKSMDEVTEYCQDNQKNMALFYQTIEQKLLAMKEDFKQDANKLIAHHASLMRDIRRDYAEEIDANRSIREEITRFQRSTDDFCHEIAENVKSESRRIDAIHREIVQDLEEIQKRRKKDRAAIEMELKDTKRQVTLEREISQEVRINTEYISRIVGLILEGERLTSAMLVQDFADRNGERWLALPAELGRRPQPPQLAESLEQHKPREGNRQPSNEFVAIDWRKGLVKSEYLPGQVAFQGVAYERRDLLLLHHKLLQKAHAAFLKGPPNEESPPAAVDSVPGQPGANGGAAAGQVLISARSPVKREGVPDEDSEDPKLSAALSSRRGAGSRQRPGSQGQPQAVGSRGTMSGPLGETAPPPREQGQSPSAAGPVGGPRAPLRLPAIGAGGDFAGREGSPSYALKSLTAR